MRIIVIGATGTIGRAIAQHFSESDGHEVVSVGHSRGTHRVDLGSRVSITALFDALGPFDALISAAGRAAFGGLRELSDDDFRLGLLDKLFGQVQLVRLGLEHVRDGGSFTLTTGVLARHPVVGSSAISAANAGLEAFVGAAALEVDRGVRVNAVSPGWVSETLERMGRDGAGGIPAAELAKVYARAVEGEMNGAVLDGRLGAS